MAGANALTNPEAGHASVSYFEKEKVSAAFAKGAVLFDGSDGRNYMVHASRREKPGQAEFHAKDADVIYVLQGTATFLTGGEVVDGKLQPLIEALVAHFQAEKLKHETAATV